MEIVHIKSKSVKEPLENNFTKNVVIGVMKNSPIIMIETLAQEFTLIHNGTEDEGRS